MIKNSKTNYTLNIYSAWKFLFNVVMLFWLFLFQTFLKQAVIAEAHTCVFTQELLSWAVCVYQWKAGALFFAHHHLDCFQLIMPLKNVKKACQFYIRAGITSHIFNFTAKNILLLESFYWTLLPLMSIWMAPAVQSGFLANTLWEAGYTCSLSLKHLNYNLGRNLTCFSLPAFSCKLLKFLPVDSLVIAIYYLQCKGWFWEQIIICVYIAEGVILTYELESWF